MRGAPHPSTSSLAALRRLLRDRRGANALEVAVTIPVLLLLVFIVIQFGIYFMAQAALDTCVLTTAEAQRKNMAAGSSYAPPSASTLKSSITTGQAGLLIASSVILDVQQMQTLSAGNVPIADGTTDWGGSSAILVMRAQATVNWFVPGTTTGWTVTSMAIMRRPPY